MITLSCFTLLLNHLAFSRRQRVRGQLLGGRLDLRLRVDDSLFSASVFRTVIVKVTASVQVRRTQWTAQGCFFYCS